MGLLFIGLGAICGLCTLVPLIMVIMKMFERDQKGLGIACIILCFCTGIGSLIAFVVGWMHATDWGLKKVMLAWTGLIVAAFVFYAAGIALSPGLVNPNSTINIPID